MESTQIAHRLHPLMAGAAVSVMLVSIVGMAAITGLLPNSHSAVAPTTPVVVSPVAAAQIADTAPRYAPQVVHHRPAVRAAEYDYAREAPARHYTPASTHYEPPYQQPVQQPVAQHSPVGITAGAVIGGLLGHQVGGGNGRTLATVAGALGGGYLGDVVGKKYGY